MRPDAPSFSEGYNADSIREELTRPFRYCGAGCTCVCYASGSLVLKVFREPEDMVRQFRSLGIDLAAAGWSPAPGDELESAHRLQNRSIEAIQRALLELPEETGLITCRTSAGFDGVRVAAIGPLRRQAIALDDAFWLLQKRMDPLGRSLLSADAPTGARLIGLLVDCIERLWSRDATDRVLNFLDNYGRLDGRVAFLDVADLAFDSDLIRKQREERRILQSHSFRVLETSRPDLAKELVLAVSDRWRSSDEPA